MHVRLKSSQEIDLMREANLIVSDVLDICEEMVAPGITTWDLEIAARNYIEKVGAKSAFLNYRPFSNYKPYPAVLCTSVNEQIVHGIPSKSCLLKEGDIISVDFGVYLNGYCGDSARTFGVGKISKFAQKLLETTKSSLESAIKKMFSGNRLSDISHAIQSHVEAKNFNVIRDYVGHGIGQKMHEPPQVPNFGIAGRGLLLQRGLVLAIEPMVVEGLWDTEVLDDGWTVVTKDKKLSAHFEHSVAITDDGPLILSRRY